MRTNTIVLSPTAAASSTGRAGWRGVVRSVLGAPARIHHYRDLRTKAMRDAFCRMDCGLETQDCSG